jgi:DHA2 family multidrug resistance protein
MMVLSLAAIPLVLLLRKPGTPATIDHSAVME